jgi:excinuclease ABC subunit C
VGIFDEKDHVVINLHIGQQNAGSHSKNLRGMSAVSSYSDVTKLFQRIRDESHRFAVSYHTVLKRKRQVASVLDEIPGIGPKTKKKLLQKFGSVKAVSSATDEDLAKVVGAARMQNVRQYLNKS